MDTLTYDTSMQQMFAAVSDLYARYWGDCFHFAIFENETESWEEALARTRQGYIAAMGVRVHSISAFTFR
jgi:hypothetical protein